MRAFYGTNEMFIDVTSHFTSEALVLKFGDPLYGIHKTVRLEFPYHTVIINDELECVKVEKRKGRKLVDVFLFCNELDLLELRLTETDDVVDYFVIVEATQTFTRTHKPLNYQANKDRYKKWHSKIIYLVIENFPETTDAWKIESFCRNFAQDKLKEICDGETLILSSDLDEIANPDILEMCKYQTMIEAKVLEMPLYYYNTQCKSIHPWRRAAIVKYSVFITKYHGNLQHLRDTTFQMGIIEKAGWHFSYFLTYEQIRYKLQAFSHTEYSTEKYTSLDYIQASVEAGKDLFGSNNLTKAPENDALPKHIRMLPRFFHPIG
ncbi:Glycosyltransferase family 17 [uncultured virus]|nr:Glycosyltransferase family 17 [uncultured virus]